MSRRLPGWQLPAGRADQPCRGRAVGKRHDQPQCDAEKLKELGIECPYNDLAEKHWSYCDLMEATIPHSAEEWHGLSYNDGNYNIIVEKFVDQNGKELAETVTTAGKEERSP